MKKLRITLIPCMEWDDLEGSPEPIRAYLEVSFELREDGRVTRTGIVRKFDSGEWVFLSTKGLSIDIPEDLKDAIVTKINHSTKFTTLARAFRD